eukprot:3385793-Pyramimonas_sp.AAC.1
MFGRYPPSDLMLHLQRHVGVDVIQSRIMYHRAMEDPVTRRFQEAYLESTGLFNLVDVAGLGAEQQREY